MNNYAFTFKDVEAAESNIHLPSRDKAVDIAVMMVVSILPWC